MCVYGLGHTNFALADNAVVIVLTKMNSVIVDVENKASTSIFHFREVTSC